ncbi:uncharacterized protein LOC130647311 [Hydractinia symbiolongicarpus]|uniref:uncharacterized protein LOC130647311 n=1 Tax=Hydractinia symbiolongicarpus TaxID=13093 RepID=UPI00254F1721|nr:uncharacterized protein LOC130647311 [Hydractinia symbiolongicarpus]
MTIQDRESVMATSLNSIKGKARPYFVNWSAISGSHFVTSDLGRRFSTSVLDSIILESSNENMELNNNNDEEINVKTKNNDGTNHLLSHSESDAISGIEYMRPRRRVKNPNKIYRLKKHLSDYDIVYLHVDSTDDDGNTAETSETSLPRRPPSAGAYDSSDSDESEMVKRSLLRQHSKSESNINIQPLGPTVCPVSRIKKSSSHRDITSTQMYKEIYADNLRQYGFLLAKQLGTSNQSPDQLRKTYLKNRQRATERRERDETSENGRTRRRRSDIESPILTRRKISSNSSSTSDLSSSKYTDSLTDITNVGNERESIRKPSTVIRRKKYHVPRDPTKRLSAPQLPSNGRLIEDIVRKTSLPSSPTKSSSMSSLSVPDLSIYADDIAQDDKPLRKLSEESRRRHMEAKERQNYRMSRLTSFEGVLSQANKLMKDIKTRQKTSPSTSSEVLCDTL